MFAYFQKLLGQQGLAPHGYCLLWDPALIWTHVASDALIGVAYFSIPIAMAYFLTQRRDVAFGWVVWMFAAFIMACGATHFLSIWVLWHADYGVEGLVKALTAAVSVVTAVALWPLLPKAIALPSSAQLQAVNADLVMRVAERDAALAALERESRERQEAQDMLRQAQKMEAVGQLSGGVAHDFNNLLTVVIANLDRAKRLGTLEDRVATSLNNALAGAERAAKLTDQLLSFSRRQPLQAEVLNLNTVIADVQPLFERSLDPSISVVSQLAEDLWPVKIDANQTGNALLNLIVNARDAIAGPGTITVTTRNAAAGTLPGMAQDAVVLEVADTGSGMKPEVAAKAFEPFFTTKGPGRGTGLGLSQVYGFIRQSEGDVIIESKPGNGTLVRIVLPRVAGEV